MSVETKYAWSVKASTESYLLETGVDLSPLHRMDSIMGRTYDVLDLVDNIAVAHRRCSDESCCGPESLPGDRYSVEETSLIDRVGWVYANLTFDGEIVYVGKTTRRLPERTFQHYHDESSARRRMISRTGKSPDLIAGWCVGDACHRLEKAAILVLQPALNTAGLS